MGLNKDTNKTYSIDRRQQQKMIFRWCETILASLRKEINMEIS